MTFFDRVVEQRIEVAIAAGELDDLPGKPLDDRDRIVERYSGIAR